MGEHVLLHVKIKADSGQGFFGFVLDQFREFVEQSFFNLLAHPCADHLDDVLFSAIEQAVDFAKGLLIAGREWRVHRRRMSFRIMERTQKVIETKITAIERLVVTSRT